MSQSQATNNTQAKSLPQFPVFNAAPVPVFNEDGDITVVSALTAPTIIPTSTPFIPTATPVDSIVVSNQPAASAALVPSQPLAAANATAIVPRQPLSEQTNNNKPKPKTTTTVTKKTTTTVVKASPATAAPRGPHKTYPKEVEQMKKRRKGATVAIGIAGGIVGAVALGPLGGIAGGVGAAAATRAVGKRQERKKREKIANREIAKQLRNAPDVKVHQGTLL